MSKNYAIKVIDRSGRTLADFTGNKVSGDMILGDFRNLLIKESDHLRKKNMVPERIRLTIGDAKGEALIDRRKKMSEYLSKVDSSKEITLVFKDLGRQVSWQTVFIVEYFGPILITLLFVVFQKQIYGEERPLTYNQKLGVTMVVCHYLKREYETFFVHRFSNDTMPFFNLFKNSFHYWFVCGVLNMYFFVHPLYTPPAWANDSIFTGFCVAFFFFEFLNLKTHAVLRDLRKPGSSERGIPHGWGFDTVSCANYLWESMCWLCFAVQGQTIGGYIFLIFSVGQMTEWALKKHRRYRKEFPNYPKNRKAMFPFII